MTGAREGIDPRYDARFQRGYDGHGADASAAASPAAAVPSAVPSAGASAAASPAMPSSAAAAEPGAPVLFGLFEPGAADDVAADDDRGERDLVGERPVAPAPAPESAAAPVPAPEPAGAPARPERRTWVWLAAGWAFTAAVLTAGLWLTWIVNGDVSWYVASAPSPDDAGLQLLRTLGWSFAPSLLMGGGVGLVVVTAVAVRLTEEIPWRAGFTGGFARPAAWWALLAFALAGLVAMPALVAAIQEYTVLSSGAGIVLDADGAVIDDTQQAQIDAVARGQFAQAVLSPLTLTTVGAVVALVTLEARRSLRRSLERSTPRGNG